MNQKLRKNKGILRDFMRAQYSDDRLAQLLDHSRSGNFRFVSCCCFIGIVTADHILASVENKEYGNVPHYELASLLPNASAAEIAANLIGFEDSSDIRTKGSDRLRMRRLIPMILAEIRRRRMTTEHPAPVEAEGVTNGA